MQHKPHCCRHSPAWSTSPLAPQSGCQVCDGEVQYHSGPHGGAVGFREGRPRSAVDLQWGLKPTQVWTVGGSGGMGGG